ncbi:MAG: deoxyribose-phosphate aldolase [Chitinophagaceae bacterium]|nr:deoxyribose-phosphate aldolase [Chitinophagaceae bacterium]
MNLTAYIELCLLKPDTLVADLKELCARAIDEKYPGICVPPIFVKQAKACIGTADIRVAAVIGFPFGYAAVEAKVAEIVLAIIDGADEVEMVINTIAVKNNDWQYLASEINTVMPILRSKGKKITVIIESGLMTKKELIAACDIYGAAAVDFVKLGTGFIKNETIMEQVELVRGHLAAPVQLKVCTDTANFSKNQDLVKAGANRLCVNSPLQVDKQNIV